MAPVDDLPIHFANSIHSATETIIMPTDAQAQWDMVRWVKTRPGLFLADRFGPVWVAGGGVGLTTDPFEVTVEACEGWALEEVVQEERVALWVRAAPIGGTTLSTAGPVLIALTAQRGEGVVVAYPITMPSVFRTTTYMEVPEEAALAVPLWAAIADPAGTTFAALHDLRLPPFGVRYRDRNGPDRYVELVYPDAEEQWAIHRSHRIWWYASAGATFEIGAQATDLLPYDTNKDSDGNERGTHIANTNDRGVDRYLSFYVNGQLLDGGDLDAAGVEIVSGLPKSMHKAWGTAGSTYDRVTSAHQSHSTRAVLRSTVNAIHDITLASFIEPGENVQFWSQIRQPQIWARAVLPAPQFSMDDV